MLQYVGDNAQTFQTEYGQVPASGTGAIQFGLLALAAAIELAGITSCCSAPAPTGRPLPPAASRTEPRSSARALGTDARSFVANNDAYHLFQTLNDLIITGTTSTM